VAAATRSLAIEYARHGIRVNAVSPGVVQTRLHATDTYDTSASRTPLGRVAQIADIVRGIVFLEASPFINVKCCTSMTVEVPGTEPAGATFVAPRAGAARCACDYVRLPLGSTA